MKFILVNGRTPNPQSCCVMCDQPFAASYLRDVETRLAYCSQDCYAGQCKCAVVPLESQSRAS
jgi:hypothetical protein